MRFALKRIVQAALTFKTSSVGEPKYNNFVLKKTWQSISSSDLFLLWILIVFYNYDQNYEDNCWT